MNFDIPEEHQMLREATREAMTRADRAPVQLWSMFSELGLTAICVAEHRGGVGMDPLALAVVAEEVGAVSPGMATVLVLHNATVCAALEGVTDHAVATPHLEALLSGASVGVGAIGLGAQARALRVPGVPNLVVMQRPGTEDGTLIELDENIESDTSGFEGVPWASTAGRNLMELASIGSGLPPLTAIGLGAVAVGIGRAAFDAAAIYATERKQFGKPISQFQAIQWMLADSNAELDAARLLVWHAAETLDGNQTSSAPDQGAVLAAESALRIADRAIQIHGGYGYTREYPVERLWRDARQLLVGCLGAGTLLRQRVAERLVHTAQ